MLPGGVSKMVRYRSGSFVPKISFQHMHKVCEDIRLRRRRRIEEDVESAAQFMRVRWW